MVRPHNMSRQFEFLHNKKNLKITQNGKEQNFATHSLTMSDFDGPLASVNYSHYNDPDSDPSSRIEIGLLHSNQEGKGHARRLMQHVYDRYPKSYIDWGLTTHPAATRLAEEFYSKHYDRTSYEPVDDPDFEDF